MLLVAPLPQTPPLRPIPLNPPVLPFAPGEFSRVSCPEHRLFACRGPGAEARRGGGRTCLAVTNNVTKGPQGLARKGP